jgi:hypothetical protein
MFGGDVKPMESASGNSGIKRRTGGDTAGSLEKRFVN